MIILTCDPSLTAFGWAVVEYDPASGYINLLDGGCIETKAVNKTTQPKVLKTEWDNHRALEIADVLVKKTVQYMVTDIIFENSAGSKSALAISALALVKGVILGIVATTGLPVKFVNPKAIKKKVGGASSTSKTLVMGIVSTKIPKFITLATGMTKAKREAISDALAVFIAEYNI